METCGACLLAKELSTRAHHVTVVWVKGHATMLDVRRGRTSLADKEGNDGADELAVAGAEQHVVDTDIVTTSVIMLKGFRVCSLPSSRHDGCKSNA